MESKASVRSLLNFFKGTKVDLDVIVPTMLTRSSTKCEKVLLTALCDSNT